MWFVRGAKQVSFVASDNGRPSVTSLDKTLKEVSKSKTRIKHIS